MDFGSKTVGLFWQPALTSFQPPAFKLAGGSVFLLYVRLLQLVLYGRHIQVQSVSSIESNEQ